VIARSSASPISDAVGASRKSRRDASSIAATEQRACGNGTREERVDTSFHRSEAGDADHQGGVARRAIADTARESGSCACDALGLRRATSQKVRRGSRREAGRGGEAAPFVQNARSATESVPQLRAAAGERGEASRLSIASWSSSWKGAVKVAEEIGVGGLGERYLRAKRAQAKS
jgi:hypothetical protein